MTPAEMVEIVLVTVVNIVTRARIEVNIVTRARIEEEIEGGRGDREIDPGIPLQTYGLHSLPQSHFSVVHHR